MSVDKHRAHRLPLPCSTSNRHPEEVPAQLPGRGRDRHDLHEVCAGLRFNDSRDRHLTAAWRDDDGNHAEVCSAQAVSGGAIDMRHGRDDVERKLVAGLSDTGGCASAAGCLGYDNEPRQDGLLQVWPGLP